MTNHYDYQQTLRAIWENAVHRYEKGDRDSSTYFDADESAFLESIGHSAQEVFDFAEDRVKYGDPDFETFLMIAMLRRQYFLHTMKGEKSDVVVDTGDLPPKNEAVKGIEWLPRIIAKARAKLRGEMSDDLMYGCGGDREFCKANNLHLSEFLDFVMENLDNDEAIIDFVVGRSKTAGHS